MLKAPMLLAAVLVVCVASSADARRRHHGYYPPRISLALIRATSDCPLIPAKERVKKSP